MLSPDARGYLAAIRSTTWELSKERLGWHEPLGIGTISIVIVFLRAGLPGTLAELRGYAWAAVPVLLYWGLVLVFNLLRAPFKIHQRLLGGLPPAIELSTPPRLFVEILPEDLMGLVADHTKIQARKIAGDYIGKWIRISGPVADVSDADFGLKDVCSALVLVGEERGYLIHMWFAAQPWRERLVTIRKGTTINAIGRIESVERFNLTLYDCELVQGGQQPST